MKKRREKFLKKALENFTKIIKKRREFSKKNGGKIRKGRKILKNSGKMQKKIENGGKNSKEK